MYVGRLLLLNAAGLNASTHIQPASLSYIVESGIPAAYDFAPGVRKMSIQLESTAGLVIIILIIIM